MENAALDTEFSAEMRAIIDSLPSIYTIFACKTCGIPWRDHTSECPQHMKKSYYSDLFKYMLNDPFYKSVLDVAKMNGWNGEHP